MCFKTDLGNRPDLILSRFLGVFFSSASLLLVWLQTQSIGKGLNTHMPRPRHVTTPAMLGASATMQMPEPVVIHHPAPPSSPRQPSPAMGMPVPTVGGMPVAMDGGSGPPPIQVTPPEPIVPPLPPKSPYSYPAAVPNLTFTSAPPMPMPEAPGGGVGGFVMPGSSLGVGPKRGKKKGHTKNPSMSSIPEITIEPPV